MTLIDETAQRLYENHEGAKSLEECKKSVEEWIWIHDILDAIAPLG